MRMAVILAVLALMVVGAYQWFWGGEDPSGVSGSPAARSLEAQKLAQETEALAEAEKRSTARARQLEAKQAADRAGERISTLEAEMKRWASDVLPLAENDHGKRLAREPHWVKEMVYLLEDERRMTAEEMVRLRERLEELTRPVKQALQEASYWVPGKDMATHLRALETEADEAARAYESARRKVEAMLAQTSAAPGTSPTLQEAMARLKQEWANEETAADQERQTRRRQVIAQVRHEAWEKETVRVAEDERKYLELLAEIERQKRERKRLMLEATAPSTLALYAPFLKPQPLSYQEMSHRRLFETQICVNAVATKQADPNRPRWNATRDVRLRDLHERCRKLPLYAELWSEAGIIPAE